MAHGISGPRRNKSEGAAQSRGAERKRRFHRKILAHHPFQRGRAGRRAGPPLFAFFHRPPPGRARRAGFRPLFFCAGPAFGLRRSALCGARALFVKTNRSLFYMCSRRTRAPARPTRAPHSAHSTNSLPPARSTNPPRPARFRSAPIPRRAVAVAPIHPPTDRPLRTLPVAPVAHLASPKTKPQARQARPSHLGAPTEHRANRKPLRMRIKQRRYVRHRAEAPEAHASRASAIHRHPGRREGKDASGESGS